MSFDSRTIDSFVLEAICMICDLNGRDRRGRYFFTTDQLMGARMLDRIDKAATGSDVKDPKETVSRGLSELVKAKTVKHIRRAEYELVSGAFIELFREGTLPKRLPGW